eukprot:jgi/Tetstr1/456209/TSEL_004089.t1
MLLRGEGPEILLANPQPGEGLRGYHAHNVEMEMVPPGLPHPDPPLMTKSPGANATAVPSLEWKRRWERDYVKWILPMRHAADGAGICDYRTADSQHGKKGKLQDKLRKETG